MLFEKNVSSLEIKTNFEHKYWYVRCQYSSKSLYSFNKIGKNIFHFGLVQSALLLKSNFSVDCYNVFDSILFLTHSILLFSKNIYKSVIICSHIIQEIYTVSTLPHILCNLSKNNHLRRCFVFQCRYKILLKLHYSGYFTFG